MEYLVVIVNSYLLDLTSFLIGLLNVVKGVRHYIKIIRVSKIMIIFKVIRSRVFLKSSDQFIKRTVYYLLDTPRHNYKRNMVLSDLT